jgi:16S rRNA (guanine(966)-N(2))-methyltransferase RsmD
MRVIAGHYRGRRLQPPRNLSVRPTTDRAREALFNILQHRWSLEGIRVVDLFAGTGAVSLEFASRGADGVLAVDKDLNAVRFIEETAEAWEAPVSAIQADVFRFLKERSSNVDLVFADPPYSLDQLPDLPDAVYSSGLLEPGGLLIVEHGRPDPFVGRADRLEKRSYGAVNFSIFIRPEPGVPASATDPASPSL